MSIAPKTSAELIRLIDDNYVDIMAGAEFSFSGRGNGDVILNEAFLENFKDKPVLQHILRKHVENGATFTGGLNFSGMALLSKEITMPDQINAAVLTHALKAGNLKGDPMNAWEYTNFDGPG